MRHCLLLVPACALFVSFGCGPMKAPLPERLHPETQQAIDDAWDRVLSPPDRLGHQDLLDVLVGTFAYQHGVDTFSFRAEKRFAGGKVVMEVAFDRHRPEGDRLEVTVFDLGERIVRMERYTRKEVDETYDVLFSKEKAGHDEANEATKRRWKKILELFPKPAERKAEEAPKPREKG